VGHKKPRARCRSGSGRRHQLKTAELYSFSRKNQLNLIEGNAISPADSYRETPYDIGQDMIENNLANAVRNCISMLLDAVFPIRHQIP
jgi:hypothetical protein